MSDKTDAVAQARDDVFAQMKTLASPAFDAVRLAQAFQRYEKALVAAVTQEVEARVRAECAAKVRALPSSCGSGGRNGDPACCIDGDSAIRAIMEAP